MLEQLELANLFLLPLDDERSWYRYHHLFAEALRFRLTQDALTCSISSISGQAPGSNARASFPKPPTTLSRRGISSGQGPLLSRSCTSCSARGRIPPCGSGYRPCLRRSSLRAHLSVCCMPGPSYRFSDRFGGGRLLCGKMKG